VLLTNLKNIWECSSKGNLQQNTHFKFYVDALHLIVSQAENTPSMATVDINITQFEVNANHSKRQQVRCSKSLALASNKLISEK